VPPRALQQATERSAAVGRKRAMSVRAWACSTKSSGTNERSAPPQCSLAAIRRAKTWSADASGTPEGADSTVPRRPQKRRWKLDQKAGESEKPTTSSDRTARRRRPSPLRLHHEG